MYKMAALLFFVVLFVFGICQADSTVVNDFVVFRVQNGEWYKYRSFDNTTKLTLNFTYLNLLGVPSDSIHCKWTQYVFWPNDSCVMYNFNWSNMLLLQDTTSNAWIDDDFWRLVYEDKDVDIIPME